MSPSPSPASSTTQTQSQTQTQGQQQPQPNGVPKGVPAYLRRKKEVSLFHKKPSRPFALAAMQAANGNASAGTGSTSTGNAQASQSSVVSRASPIPKPPNEGSSSTPRSTPEQRPSPSAPSTPSNSQGSTSVATPSNTASEPAPQIGYTDFRVVSTDLHGWKYDVMKFDSRKPIDINVWARPVKLNRKEIRRPETNSGETAPVAVGPMLGPDGKPVIGADGRTVMVDAEGRPIHDAKPNGSAVAGPSGSAAKNGNADKNKKKKFQKKTRQVFLVPDHIRQLRKEERYPWIMEDATGKEVWEGRMEEASKAELYALFMPAPDSVFRFVPAHRWYKFQKRRTQQHTWTLEEAEKMMARMQRNKDGERWALRRRNNAAAAPTAGGTGARSLVYDIGGMSLAPGGRRLRTVDAGMRGLFEEDDEEGVQDRRRRERERDFEGDMDEMEYEEDFADDEEKVQPDDVAADEEAKELEERLKREYRQANKTREGYIDESDEEDADNLTGTGKDIKKLVRKIEKNAAYESDEDKNPYASSEEEEEEETPAPVPTGPAVQDQTTSKPGSAPQSKAGSRPTSKPPSRPTSRSGSPAPPGSGGSTSVNAKVKTENSSASLMPPPPTSPVIGMGGHLVVAKRATSTKTPKLKGQPGGSRATSPLAGGGSRATSPKPASPGASRATSPVPTSAGLNANPSKKRKADGDAGGGTGSLPGTPGPGAGGAGQQPKLKKRKPIPGSTPGTPGGIKSEPGTDTKSSSGNGSSSSQVAPGTELTPAVLVAWLRVSPGTTTRECIHYFQPALTDDVKKAKFTALVKEVASLKGGVLALKGQYRDGNGGGGEGKAV